VQELELKSQYEFWCVALSSREYTESALNVKKRMGIGMRHYSSDNFLELFSTPVNVSQKLPQQ